MELALELDHGNGVELEVELEIRLERELKCLQYCIRTFLSILPTPSYNIIILTSF